MQTKSILKHCIFYKLRNRHQKKTDQSETNSSFRVLKISMIQRLTWRKVVKHRNWPFGQKHPYCPSTVTVTDATISPGSKMKISTILCKKILSPQITILLCLISIPWEKYSGYLPYLYLFFLIHAGFDSKVVLFKSA